MSGDSSTTLNPGSGGNVIYNELLGDNTTHMPASKIHNGNVGVDGGPITAANPFQVRNYDGSSNPIFPTAAAAADAESNSTLVSRVGAYLFGANGTPTWDRIRAGVTSIGSTYTGFLNLLPIAIYNSTRTTRSTGQGGPFEVNAQGDLTVQGARLSITSFTTLATTGSLIFSGKGIVYWLSWINTTGSANFGQVFDTTSNPSNGTVALQTSSSTANNGQTQTALGSSYYGLPVTNGLYLKGSSTLAQMTALVSTANAGYVLYLAG